MSYPDTRFIPKLDKSAFGIIDKTHNGVGECNEIIQATLDDCNHNINIQLLILAHGSIAKPNHFSQPGCQIVWNDALPFEQIKTLPGCWLGFPSCGS
jgi:hypothetical protein